jgi:hypothetical protein
VTCAATPVIDVPAGARALVLARVRAFADGSAVGDCFLGTSSVGVIPNTQHTFLPDDGKKFYDSVTLVGVSPVLPVGSTSFGVDCNQVSGDIEYDEVGATVVLIASN